MWQVLLGLRRGCLDFKFYVDDGFHGLGGGVASRLS